MRNEKACGNVGFLKLPSQQSSCANGWTEMRFVGGYGGEVQCSFLSLGTTVILIGHLPPLKMNVLDTAVSHGLTGLVSLRGLSGLMIATSIYIR